MLGGVPAAARADVPVPAAWPQTAALQPQIDTTAYSIRFGGADRYQTNLTTNLALRGNGGYPFSTPDPSSGWWGVGVCPRSIIVVAGDVFADALTAASLSDPTDKAAQPRLRVAASSDPVFLPVGTLDRPDTAQAPIVITPSARQGATGLGATARSTAIDFNHGGCTAAKQAIIVGGATSVPTGVAQELVGLGYDEVFRVGGVDRYDTAAQIAAALGTGSGTSATACTDPDTTDGSARMGWYGNAVAEFRPDATTCELLPRAVVLADGGQGADALAAGWWTSFWQVPMLLTAPDGSLPPATQEALRTLGVDAIIVLGGTGRIPESTAVEASTLAGGAAAGRIAGNDRYETSVLMAEELGGWWPTGHAADFAGSMVCVAASGGDTGWPDALAAGPWCGAANGGAASPGAPGRLLAPTEGSAPLEVRPGQRPAHDAVPVLLTIPSASVLAPSASTFLSAAFDPAGDWCNSETGGSCEAPGFAVGFGGTGLLTDAARLAASALVSGGHDGATEGDTSIGMPFVTNLDLSPIFDAAARVDQICFGRSAMRGVRWLDLPVNDRLDVPIEGIYRADGDGVARSPGSSRPFCRTLIADGAVTGTSASGHVADPSIIERSRRLSMSGPLALGVPTSVEGAPIDSDDAGTATRVTFTTGALPQSVNSDHDESTISAVSVSAALLRGATPDAPRVFTGAFMITTRRGLLTATFDAEARRVDGVWVIRGSVAWSGGTWNVSGGSGGFVAELGAQLSFRADGVTR